MLSKEHVVMIIKLYGILVLCVLEFTRRVDERFTRRGLPGRVRLPEPSRINSSIELSFKEHMLPLLRIILNNAMQTHIV